jgi:hypothetical protein
VWTCACERSPYLDVGDRSRLRVHGGRLCSPAARPAIRPYFGNEQHMLTRRVRDTSLGGIETLPCVAGMQRPVFPGGANRPLCYGKGRFPPGTLGRSNPGGRFLAHSRNALAGNMKGFAETGANAYAIPGSRHRGRRRPLTIHALSFGCAHCTLATWWSTSRRRTASAPNATPPSA